MTVFHAIVELSKASWRVLRCYPRLVWFPLHPIGFIAANSWGMQINWVSFLVGWLIKVLVTRYGGLRVYNRLLPLFLGLIVGDALHSGLWGLVAWATGGGGGR